MRHTPASLAYSDQSCSDLRWWYGHRVNTLNSNCAESFCHVGWGGCLTKRTINAWLLCQRAYDY